MNELVFCIKLVRFKLFQTIRLPVFGHVQSNFIIHSSIGSVRYNENRLCCDTSFLRSIVNGEAKAHHLSQSTSSKSKIIMIGTIFEGLDTLRHNVRENEK